MSFSAAINGSWGLLSCVASPPTAPTITVSDDADGGGVTITISGSDSGTTNTAYTAAYGGSFAVCDSRTGDGTIDATVSLGKNWVFVISSNLSGQSVSNVAIVTATDGAELAKDAFDTAFSNSVFATAFGTDMDYTRGLSTIRISAMDSVIDAEQLLEYGASLTTESREFIFLISEIEELSEPLAGDTIKDGRGYTFEISKVGSAPAWEYDADRSYYRVRGILIS